MNSIQRIFKNVSAEIINFGINFLVTMLFSIILVRYLGPEIYGKYSLSFNFASFFGVFVGFGFGGMLTDRIAKDKSVTNLYLSNVLVIQMGLGIIVSLTMIIIAILLNYSKDVVIAISIISITMVSSQIYTTINSVFRAYERLELNSIVAVISRIASALFGTLLLIIGYRLIPMVASNALITFFQVLMGLVFLNKMIGKIRFKLALKMWKNLLIGGIPFFIASFFMALRLNAGPLLVSKFATEFDLGIFNAAFRPIALLSLIAIAFANALFPIMSRNGFSHLKLLEIYTIVTKMVIIVIIPFAFVTTILSDRLILAVYGNEYLLSSKVFQILIWIIPLMFYVYPIGNILIAIEKTKLVSIALLTNGIFVIGLNIILINRIGYIGAAYATVFSELLIVILYSIFINRNIGSINNYQTIVKPIIINIISILVFFVVKPYSLFFSITLYSIVYLFLVIIFKIINQKEKDIFYQLFQINSILKNINKKLR